MINTLMEELQLPALVDDGCEDLDIFSVKYGSSFCPLGWVHSNILIEE
jgi:hypothetical protein